MRDSVLWRKIARIIILLSEKLDISENRAMDLFYNSKVYRMMKTLETQMHIMSDKYILEEFMLELQGR